MLHNSIRLVHRPALRTGLHLQGRTQFLAFVRYLRSLRPPEVRIATVADNFSPHLSTRPTTGSVNGRRRATSNSPTRHRLARSTSSRGARECVAVASDDVATDHRCLLAMRGVVGTVEGRKSATATPTTAHCVSWFSAQTLPNAAPARPAGSPVRPHRDGDRRQSLLARGAAAAEAISRFRCGVRGVLHRGGHFDTGRNTCNSEPYRYSFE
jgi:hypothetical protein